MNSLMGCFADCPFGILDGFFTSNPTNPEKRWPGTKWRQIKGRFILAADDTHPADSTGGEFEHKLTVDEMPKHFHSIAKGNQVTAEGAPQFGEYQAHQNEPIITPGKYWTADTLNAGGNRPHNITPPLFFNVFLAKNRVASSKAGWRCEKLYERHAEPLKRLPVLGGRCACNYERDIPATALAVDKLGADYRLYAESSGQYAPGREYRRRVGSGADGGADGETRPLCWRGKIRCINWNKLSGMAFRPELGQWRRWREVLSSQRYGIGQKSAHAHREQVHSLLYVAAHRLTPKGVAA